MARKRDIRQFRQACHELGFSAEQRYEASEALHDEKEASGERAHMTYKELIAWLQQWMEA